jgi:hypothetical protein
MKLACGNCIVGTVGATVYIQAAGTANPFAAVVVECHRFFILPDQLFIQDIEHLEEGTIRGYSVQGITEKFPL